nr:unnamed protein product [Digitaria exilis]
MDRIPVASLKSRSFSAATTREDKLARNLLLGPIKLNDHIKEARVEKLAADDAAGETPAVPEEVSEPDFATLSAEIDAFLDAHGAGETLPAVSEVTLDRFATAVEQEIAPSDCTDDKWVPEVAGEDPPLLASIKRIAAFASALTAGESKYTIGVHRVTGVLHRVMTFVEDEFHFLLEDPRIVKTAVVSVSGDSRDTPVKPMKRPPSFNHGAAAAEPDRCVVVTSSDGTGEPFPPDTVEKLRAMAEAMLAAGYETECREVFAVARRNALDASLQSMGYERSCIDDVVNMPGEALESEIATWIKAFRHVVEVDLPGERDLSRRVFSGSGSGDHHLGRAIFADLAHSTMLQMLGFTEAVVLTKRAAEGKLFMVLDMYECIRDVAVPAVDAFAAGDDAILADVKHELASVLSRLGESAAAIFCDVESSIREDARKQPLPGAVVNPVTRYMMNYLKYACEYKKTLEQIFMEHRRPENDDGEHAGGGCPFAAELMEVMKLLHGNMEAKSRMYEDPLVSSIFLMNNGRYMLRMVRGSPEIDAVAGEEWTRKLSADLGQYHKKYQRERWSRVLNLPITRIKQV